MVDRFLNIGLICLACDNKHRTVPFLGDGKILLIGNVIEQEFMVAYDWNLGSGLSLVLLFFIIINVIVSVLTDREED